MKMKIMKHQNLIFVSIDYFLFCVRGALNYRNQVTIKFKKLYVTLLSYYTLVMTVKFTLLYSRMMQLHQFVKL